MTGEVSSARAACIVYRDMENSFRASVQEFSENLISCDRVRRFSPRLRREERRVEVNTRKLLQVVNFVTFLRTPTVQLQGADL